MIVIKACGLICQSIYVSSATLPLLIFPDSESTDVWVDHSWKSPPLTDEGMPFKHTQLLVNVVHVIQSQNTTFKNWF